MGNTVRRVTSGIASPFSAARRLTPGIAALTTCLALTGCGGSDESDQATPDNPAGVVISTTAGHSTYLGAEPAAPYSMPDLTLTATNGMPFNLVTDTAYPITLVFFGYTHCPDVCPLVMSDVTSAIVQLPDDVRDETQLVFITTDPQRDTADVLRDYLDHYNKDYVGLTGDLRTIVAAAGDMGVAIEGRKRLPGGGYDVGHGAQVIGFHGDRAPVIWTPGTPVPDMVHDIVRLAGS